MTLRTDEGDTVVVTGNRAYDDHVRTYNLTVDDLHTFYVLAGDVPVLVHNSTPCISTKLSQKQYRHVEGRPEFGGGSYLKSFNDGEQVLDAYHAGRTTVLGTTKEGHTVIRYDGVTGYNNNPGAGYVDQPTNVFMIKGTAKPSIVPTNPNWTP